MLNKKGFTLVELLAVIVLISIIASIGAVALSKTKKQMDKKIFDTKLDLLLQAAIDYGEDNSLDMSLDSNIICKYTSDSSGYANIGVTGKYKSVTAGVLQTQKYYDSEESLTNIDGNSIAGLNIIIYKKNNRLYSCIDYANMNLLLDSSGELYKNKYCYIGTTCP